MNKIGIVAYDDVSKKGADLYKDLFNKIFTQNTSTPEYQVDVGWNSITDLTDFVMNEGVHVINELDRILILDNGFTNQLTTSGMIDAFVSLQEVFNNRGVAVPRLTWATLNQAVYDWYNTRETTAEGHDLFSYGQTYLIRLQPNSEGTIVLSDLVGALKGEFDETALSVKSDFVSKEETAKKTLQQMQEGASGGANNIHNAKEIVRQRKAMLGKNKGALPTFDDDKPTNQNEFTRSGQTSFNGLKSESPIGHSTNGSSNSSTGGSANRNLGGQPDLASTSQQARPIKPLKFNSGKQIDDDNPVMANINGDKLDSIKIIRQNAAQLRSGKQENFFPKITQANGVIVVGGAKGSGASEIAANLAYYYSYVNKSVTLVNVSRSSNIIESFGDFKKVYHELGRNYSLRTNLFKTIKDIAVPISSRIEVISDIDEQQADSNANERMDNIVKILQTSGADIKIVYAGDELAELLDRMGPVLVNELLIVAKQDTINRIHLEQSRSDLFLNELTNIENMSLVVNDMNYSQSNDEIAIDIMNLPKPLDQLKLVCKIGHDENWYRQRLSKTEAVAVEKSQLYNFEQIAKYLIV